VKIEALAQLGDMLKSMEKNRGERGQFTGGSKGEPPVVGPPTLKELKIDKKTSMVAQQLAAMPEEIRQAIAGCLRSFCMPILPYHSCRGDEDAGPRTMNFEQLRKACSSVPRCVPLLVAEAIWRRGLVEKIGHQSYPSWFEAALKRHGVRLHRELYLREDPSEPIPTWKETAFPYATSSSIPDWLEELRQQQLAMDKHT